MALPILSKLQKLSDVLDIPSGLLLSLFFQVYLVLFASFRQRSRNSSLHSLIWWAYLSADWIAAVTLGLITKVLTDDTFHLHHNGNRDLYALWASFLLLHLGGPDTITSIALEDNEFWLRDLLGLIQQVMGAAYCIFLTLPNNNLWLPTILVFVVGSVKYAERTMALYLASLDHFLDTVPDFGDSNTEPEPEPESGCEDPNAEPEPRGTKFDFNLAPEPNHIELLMVSYSLFRSFKGIIFENIWSPKVIDSSRMLFSQIKNPKVGFKLIEYELSLMYEVLHTKVAVVRSRIGLVFRLSSFCFIVGALITFRFVVKDGDHHEFGGFEMSLTYALLIGAVVLDTISGIKLMIFSDWILVSNNGLIKRWRKLIPECVLKRRRWRGSVSQYNMIDYCLDERWIWKCNKFPSSFRVMIDYIKFMLFSSSTDNIEDLECFIFENREIISEVSTNDSMIFPNNLRVEFKYREEVLRLHLATEIGYHRTQTGASKYTEEQKRSRRVCKVISDYMFYLLIMKPELFLDPSAVTGTSWQRTFQNTFEEAKGYLMKNKISDHIKACDKLIDYYVKENDKSQTLLFNACLKARNLKLRNEYWKDLSHVWLKALKFGILRERSVILNVAQASKGGELLTFILFLFYHLNRSKYYNSDDVQV